VRTRTQQHTPPVACPERLVDGEVERLIIGNILAVPGFFRRVGPQMAEDCFAVERHRRVFQFARQLHDAGSDPTLSECYRAILATGKSNADLGLPVLSELAFDGLELANPDAWVRGLRRKQAERRAWRVSERLRLGMESGIDTLGELNAAREGLLEIESSFDAPMSAEVTLSDAVVSIGVDNLLAAPQGMIASPWERLNDLTNDGLRRGELWLAGARTGVGKSTLCLQWALAAAKAGHRVLFVSLEMPREDLLKRALAAEGDIPHGLLMQGNLESSWRFRVVQTLDRIGSYTIEITDKLRTLQAIIAKVAATSGLGLLVVDYLGLVDPGGRYENRNQEVSAISRRLKLAALDYGIPILAAHQLNRANENENRRPQLSDLRDSGSLEQDADAVLLLDTPGTRKRAEDGDKDHVDVLIAKQRNGIRGVSVPLRLEGKYCRLIETASQSESRVA
jgi:replicative DNA helicase